MKVPKRSRQMNRKLLNLRGLESRQGLNLKSNNVSSVLANERRFVVQLLLDGENDFENFIDGFQVSTIEH